MNKNETKKHKSTKKSVEKFIANEGKTDMKRKKKRKEIKRRKNGNKWKYEMRDVKMKMSKLSEWVSALHYMHVLSII